MKVIVLHCYSADNAGDGLLVDETLTLIRESLGASTEVIVVASHPETFSDLGLEVVDSGLSKTGYNLQYLRLLRGLNDADLVIAVGGGYLRAGFLKEAAKTILIHGPQLYAASITRTPTVYLPQSVGPSSSIVGRLIAGRLRKIDRFYVRDDRSLADFSDAGVRRSSDLALLRLRPKKQADLAVDPTAVLSIRAVRGKISPMVSDLAKQLVVFDGYVQSATAGNNDTAAMNAIGPRRVLDRHSLMSGVGPARVVVAVRLHAALMAIRAGHFVIHLAYERKGFGAFNDLGLENYVHNVNMFEPARVHLQIEQLLSSELEREKYADAVRLASKRISPIRIELISELRNAIKPSQVGAE